VLREKSENPEHTGFEKTMHHFEGFRMDLGIGKLFVDHFLGSPQCNAEEIAEWRNVFFLRPGVG